MILLDDREARVVRLSGIARDPTTGQHRAVVVFCSQALPKHELARCLRRAADRLDDLREKS
jgi:hypothetical protein